ncbi:MAG: hypothetical protein AB1Z57_02765 [Acidimicrobiia bacterium]
MSDRSAADEPIDPEFDRSGIQIPREVADAEGVPSELDANVGEDFLVPSPRRRRAAGWIYLVGAGLLAAGALAGLGVGLWAAAVGLVLLGGYHFVAAWPLSVDEQHALRIAVAELPFPVGHASAAVRFTGWRAKPIWHVVVYDATEPPGNRALVRVDAVTGDLVEAAFVEAL